MSQNVYLAVDLGAGSGRVMAGVVENGKMKLEEIHRFPSPGANLLGSHYWDIAQIFGCVKEGLKLAFAKYGDAVRSLGVDTWGVDYGLIDAQGRLLGMPFQYRDGRTKGMIELADRKLGKAKLYRATGNQFMFFNTVFQMLSEVAAKSPALKAADQLLFIPDLLNYFLTGKKVNERTIASTSQMLNPVTGKWALPELKKLGIPVNLLGKLVNPGTSLGPLLKQVAQETGAPKGLKVVAVGSHDTASAFAAVPAVSNRAAFVSSGTWSLFGIETGKPVLKDNPVNPAFTNEAGLCGTTRFLKILCGMWLVQETKRTWDEAGDKHSWDEITSMAATPPFAAFINPDDPMFVEAGDMPARIAAFCRKTKQTPPATKGALLRCIFESLAMKYRHTFDQLEQLAGGRPEVLHVVGGGSQNSLLNQIAADILGIPVIAGPVEATSAGNVLSQMMAAKQIKTLADGRAIVRASFETLTFQPRPADGLEDAYRRFLGVLGAGKA